MKEILTWSPRILAILFIGFLSLFALDSFDYTHSFLQIITNFLLHLIPSLLLAGCLLVAWKYRILGGLLFIVIGLVFTVYFGTFRNTSNFLTISLPPLITGVLFIISRWSDIEK